MYPRSTDIGLILQRCLPGTRAIYEYWDSKRRGRRMPSRSDIDPVEMKPWLTHLQLIDVSHNPRRMTYRLVGEIDVSFRGYNPTGQSVEEGLIGFSAEETLRNYDIVITERTVLYDWSDYVSRSGFLRSQEELLLPLSNDDELVNMIMTFAEVDVKG